MKKKVKAYLYANYFGLLTRVFYSENYRYTYFGKRASGNPILSNNYIINNWKKTDIFIEVDEEQKEG